tara:strand:- start:245 stop:772 length:528 start_codon:yes stop_codon:yes gene_type:complete
MEKVIQSIVKEMVDEVAKKSKKREREENSEKLTIKKPKTCCDSDDECSMWNVTDHPMEDGGILRMSGEGHMGSPVCQILSPLTLPPSVEEHPLKGIVPDDQLSDWHKQELFCKMDFESWCKPGKYANDSINIWKDGTVTLSIASVVNPPSDQIEEEEDDEGKYWAGPPYFTDGYN